MTLDDAPAPTRRALRLGLATTAETEVVTTADGADDATSEPADIDPLGLDPLGPDPLGLAAHEPLSPADVALAALAEEESDTDVLAVESVPPKAKAPRAPKAPRQPKEPKEPREPRALKEPRALTGSHPIAEPRVALGWIDDTAVGPRPAASDLAAATSPYVPVEPDLLARAPHRSPWRPGVIVPIAIGALLVASYATTVLLWPLHAVAPEIEPIAVQPVAAPATQPAWPAAGGAAIAVEGIGATVASTPDAIQMASITKLVTALTVLDEMPLDKGEQGPEFKFTSRDANEYWSYLSDGESAVKVPVGGTLTEYQVIEGMLIGSANNYAARLAGNLWPSDAVYAAAANGWLSAHGVAGITVVEPTGIDPRNTATPEGLITLAKKALANPVIAEIVKMPSVDLPGVGTVDSTNPLIGDPGIVGVKTGSLDSFALLTAKDVPIGDVTVRLYAAVLGQPDADTRASASRALYDKLTAELQPFPSVPAGTTVGMVETRWGEKVKVVTSSDADVILWNGGSGEVATDFDLGDARGKGAKVGALSVTGPLDATSVTLRLDRKIDGPSVWWRLTHPLDLFGLND